MRKYIIISILMLLPMMAGAQFYVTGDDPGRLRWYSLDTDNYRIIYPEGNDSLARVYGGNLEKFRVPVSRTSGYLPGGSGKLRMPVVLHTWNTSNGSVAWAPKRMDLFTIPSAYNPEPLPWEQMLSIHESRHVSQMQFGMTGAMKPFNWFFGEMFNILVSILYPNISNMEGDAVIVETAFSDSGRGRTSDFLNYYRVAFDNGLERSWSQWRFPSQRNYSPSYYSLGYLTVGGIRHFYNFPDYMDEAYHLAARKPYNFMTFHTLAEEAAGKKKWKDVFSEIADTMAVIWKAEADARAPYIPMEAVGKEPGLYTEYTSNTFIGNDLYSVKRGHLDVPVLVRNRGGKEERISTFPAVSGRIKFQGNRIFWSETLPDERWSMQTRSKIRFMQGNLVGGKAVWSGDKSLSDADRLLYNPSPSDDGKHIACVEYLIEGGSALVVLDSYDGSEVSVTAAPHGLQLVETAWIGDDIYATGITEGGYGIYRIADGMFETVLEASPVMVKDFGTYAEELVFTCDRTGVNELYHYDPQSKMLVQKTSIRHGGESFAYSPDGEWLYFSAHTVKGKLLHRTPVDSLLERTADFAVRHEYMLAESLTEQEKTAAKKARACDCNAEPEFSGKFSEPVRYRKFPHMFNVHSWAPVYVNVNRIMNMSFDHIYEAASLGATGIIQNRLSTATGEFGYSAHKDPYDKSVWRHSGHARFTYTGLYPVIEASVDFNDRASRQYNVKGQLLDNGSMLTLTSKGLSSPSLKGTFKTYIPFNLSSGGWYRGIIPQLSYSITNDYMNNALVVTSQKYQDGYGTVGGDVFVGSDHGKNHLMQYMNGSIRMYTMQGTSNSCVYPRWGIGLEVGGWANLNAPKYFSPMGYAYMYGYLPGFMRSQGIKLTAMYQTKLNDASFGQNIVNVLPRGFGRAASLQSSLTVEARSMLRLTADYAIPIYIGDISLFGNFFYIKRLTVTPHFDYTFIYGKYSNEGIWSAGANIGFDLESIAWISWPCSVGVTTSYNGGPSYYEYDEIHKIGRFYVGPTFNVSF